MNHSLFFSEKKIQPLLTVFFLTNAIKKICKTPFKDNVKNIEFK